MTHQKIPVQFLLFWKDLKPSGCQGCLHSIKRLAGVSGLTITDNVDITYLEQPFHDAHQLKPLLDRYPEYIELVGRVFHLYKEITDKALTNE